MKITPRYPSVSFNNYRLMSRLALSTAEIKIFFNGNFMNGKPKSLAMEINTAIIKMYLETLACHQVSPEARSLLAGESAGREA